MSTLQISLRLGGNLPSLEELTETLGMQPTEFRRRGDRISKKRVQPVDVWILELAKFDTDTDREERERQMLNAATTLQEISSSLARIDRNNCNTDLYITSIREEDRGR